MSNSAAQSQPGSQGPSPEGTGRPYRLTDGLAKLCLERGYKDSYRKLAWANSICALFLVVGVVGLKPSSGVVQPLSETIESIPVVLIPMEVPPQPIRLEAQKQPATASVPPIDTPEVVPVVAAADRADVAFAVPVQGRIAVAPAARFVPPPAVSSSPSAPVKFNPQTGAEGGFYPAPGYPVTARRNRYEGTVNVEILVGEDGRVLETEVRDSSGYPLLDEAAVEVVQKRWRFPAGESRRYVWSCVFQLR